MTMPCINIIENVSSRYGALDHFQKKLQEAFHRAGISSHSFNLQKQTEEEISLAFQKNRPDYTIGFNVIISGHAFQQSPDIPHIALLVDPLWQFPELFSAPNVIPAFVEKDSALLFGKESLYLPHAIEPKALQSPLNDKREFEVVLPASFIDSDKELRDWNRGFSKKTVETLCAIAEEVLTSEATLLKAFSKSYPAIQEEVDSKQIPTLMLLSSLSTYIRGEDKKRLLAALKNFDVHIFCSKEDGTKWKSIGKVHIHEAVPFPKLSTIYQKSKIVLQSSPQMKHGFHERLFMALAYGASVLSMSNSFYNSTFGINRANIAITQYKDAPSKIQEILLNEEKRLKDVQAAREVIAKSHTWDNRVQELLDQLNKKTAGRF